MCCGLAISTQLAVERSRDSIYDEPTELRYGTLTRIESSSIAGRSMTKEGMKEGSTLTHSHEKIHIHGHTQTRTSEAKKNDTHLTSSPICMHSPLLSVPVVPVPIEGREGEQECMIDYWGQRRRKTQVGRIEYSWRESHIYWTHSLLVVPCACVPHSNRTPRTIPFDCNQHLP